MKEHLTQQKWLQGAYKVVKEDMFPISGGKVPTIDALDIDLSIDIS
jgi:hypothetical protein